jgi:hypothetical protein
MVLDGFQEASDILEGRLSGDPLRVRPVDGRHAFAELEPDPRSATLADRATQRPDKPFDLRPANVAQDEYDEIDAETI